MLSLLIEGLGVQFKSGDYTVRPFENFNLKASDGQLVVLLGPSGSGKTTLLSCLAGILTPNDGCITVGDVEVTALSGDPLTHYRRDTVGIVFQAFNLIPSLTALENVAAPMLVSGTPRRKAKKLAAELLERVGLTDRASHLPAELSGGQQQRVAIARALIHDPPILIADEPTAHLDFIQVESVLSLLRDLAVPGRIIVVATHDDRFIPLADRTVHLGQQPVSRAPPEPVMLVTGEVLFRQGEPGDRIFVVEEGSVQIYRERADGTEEPLTVVEPGNYFGELAPLLGLPRAACARAATQTRLTGYSVRDFRALAKTDPRFARFLSTAPGLKDEATQSPDIVEPTQTVQTS